MKYLPLLLAAGAILILSLTSCAGLDLALDPAGNFTLSGNIPEITSSK
jgi:hypothetical protein